MRGAWRWDVSTVRGAGLLLSCLAGTSAERRVSVTVQPGVRVRPRRSSLQGAVPEPQEQDLLLWGPGGCRSAYASGKHKKPPQQWRAVSGAAPGRLVSGPGTTLPRRLCYTLFGVRRSGLRWCPSALWEMECIVFVVQSSRELYRAGALSHGRRQAAPLWWSLSFCGRQVGSLAYPSVRPSVNLSICPGVRPRSAPTASRWLSPGPVWPRAPSRAQFGAAMAMARGCERRPRRGAPAEPAWPRPRRSPGPV